MPHIVLNLARPGWPGLQSVTGHTVSHHIVPHIVLNLQFVTGHDLLHMLLTTLHIVPHIMLHGVTYSATYDHI